MAELESSLAALRILGETLNPDEITRLLGVLPTTGYLKGQVQYKTKLYKVGGWILDATPREPANLDAQVAELFSRVNTDLAVWTALSRKYALDLFCGVFMRADDDEGLVLSTETMKMLSERGIKLSLCIYAPSYEDERSTG